LTEENGKLERAKGFEPCTEKSQVPASSRSSENAYSLGAHRRAQVIEEEERLRVYAAWPQLRPKVQRAILDLVDLHSEEEV
jgi:hypothetical protein